MFTYQYIITRNCEQSKIHIDMMRPGKYQVFGSLRSHYHGLPPGWSPKFNSGHNFYGNEKDNAMTNQMESAQYHSRSKSDSFNGCLGWN